jgi:hypothetical protein
MRLSLGLETGGSVKDIHAVLQQKEQDLARVQAEIDALRLVIPLLGEEASPTSETLNSASESSEDKPLLESRATGTEGPTFSAMGNESGFWKRRR